MQANDAEGRKRYDYRIKYRQGKEAVLPDALSRRDQDMPYGIGDDRLQARFKRLIPETCVHHPPARPEAYVEGKDPNCSLPRQRVSQIFEKFANLSENRDSSRTLHVGATNSGSHTNRSSFVLRHYLLASNSPRDTFAAFFPRFKRELMESDGVAWPDYFKISYLERALNVKIINYLITINPDRQNYPDFIKNI